MSIIDKARAYECKYHEDLYSNHDLFEPGTWLHKPAAYAVKSFDLVTKSQNIRALDLGGGVGRHSIPAAIHFGPGAKIICVDLLSSAIKKLMQNASKHNVSNVVGVKSDIEIYNFAEQPYDLILSISCIEHVPTKARLEKLIHRLQNVTKIDGVHCFMIITNNEWIESDTDKKLTPLIEQNLSSTETIEMLRRLYKSWTIHDLTTKDWQASQHMDGRDVVLKSTCVQFTAQKQKKAKLQKSG